jgi:hypothetical protein
MTLWSIEQRDRVLVASLTRGYHALLLMLRDLPKPIIVAMRKPRLGPDLSARRDADGAALVIHTKRRGGARDTEALRCEATKHDSRAVDRA